MIPYADDWRACARAPHVVAQTTAAAADGAVTSQAAIAAAAHEAIIEKCLFTSRVAHF